MWLVLMLDQDGQGRSCWIQMLNSGLQSLCDWLMQVLNIHISKSVRFFSAVQLLLACVCRVDCRRCRTQAGNHLVTDARFGQEGFSKSVRFFSTVQLLLACVFVEDVELRQALVLWLMQAMEKVDFSGRPRSRGSGEKGEMLTIDDTLWWREL